MRTCGCGKRGRHKPTCSETGKPTQVIKKSIVPSRSCGCGTRGRHKKECALRQLDKTIQIIPELNSESKSLYELYISGYGKPPSLSWYPNKTRQRTVERRIGKLVSRYKAFYLTTITTSSLDNPSAEKETWFIDGGNWISKMSSEGKYNLVGHVKNVLPFLQGSNPIPWGDWDKPQERIKPKRRRK